MTEQEKDRRVSGFKMGRFSFRRERAIFCYK